MHVLRLQSELNAQGIWINLKSNAALASFLKKESKFTELFIRQGVANPYNYFL